MTVAARQTGAAASLRRMTAWEAVLWALIDEAGLAAWDNRLAEWGGPEGWAVVSTDGVAKIEEINRLGVRIRSTGGGGRIDTFARLPHDAAVITMAVAALEPRYRDPLIRAAKAREIPDPRKACGLLPVYLSGATEPDIRDRGRHDHPAPIKGASVPRPLSATTMVAHGVWCPVVPTPERERERLADERVLVLAALDWLYGELAGGLAGRRLTAPA